MSTIGAPVLALLATLQASGAVATNRSACEKGDLAACNTLAGQYESGISISRDHAEAGRIYERTCNAGFSRSCVNLGLLRLEANGPTDHEEAAGFFAKGCELQNAFACYRLGLLLQAGDGVPKSTTQAAAAHDKACAGGNTWGCHALAELLKKGDGVPSDADRAASLFKKACEGGYALSCLAAGTRSSHSCRFEIGRRFGEAAVVVEHGHVAELAIDAFSPPHPSGNGCCSLGAKRHEGDERDGGELATWKDDEEGGLTISWKDYDDSTLVVRPTRAGFEVDLMNWSGSYRWCGFGAEFPARVVVDPSSGRCKVTFHE